MKEWFYTITESMLDLGIRDTELNLFAILNGYSQKGDGLYYGTRRGLAERCGVSSLQTIDNALRNLIDKGLVERFTSIIKGEERICYAVPKDVKIDTQKLYTEDSQGTQKLDTPYPKIEQGGYPKNRHNKKESNKTQTEKTIPPTPQEVAEYAKQRGFADPVGFAAVFCEICKNNNWRRGNGQGDPIVNWKNYIVSNWEQYHKNKRYPQTSTARPSATLSHEELVKTLQ